MQPVGFRKHVLETREPLLFDEQHAGAARRVRQPDGSGGAAQVGRCASHSSSARRATGVDLAPEPRTRARVQRGRRAPALDARRQPQRRARERTAVRGDPAAERRARTDQRVQRGLAENLDLQAMYELVGDRLQEIFDAQVVDIGVLDRDRQAAVPVLDRAWRPLPGRAEGGLGGLVRYVMRDAASR